MSNNTKPPQSRSKEDELERKANRLAYVIAPLLVLLVCYYYGKITGPPPLPNIDLQEWWGTYPIDIEPDTSIKPYKVDFPEVIINDLKERLLHRRPFTPPLENAGFSYGFNTDFLTRVLDFWQTSYNFEERENFLNKFDQYVTNIQGLDIHFIHVKPKARENVAVIPLLMIHSWPSSVREFYDVIPLLTTHRINQEFVFEVIVPSLPGFGFSQAATRPGFGPIQIAMILHNLMKRVGYEKYYVHGGDFGHAIGSTMATVFPDNILGLHSNMPVIYCNPYLTLNTIFGVFYPFLVVESDVKNRMYPLGEHTSKLFEESGYFHIQATKPDTVGVALTESPAGLAAYILEKFSTWTNLEYRKASDGGLQNKFSLTHLLDNVMIYWITNSITTSMRPYAEYYSQMYIIDQTPTEVPVWGIKFKHELHFTPDSFLKKMKYYNYLQSTIVEDGGHFPAMEHPQILADDIYGSVNAFRHFHEQKNPSPQLPKKPEPQPKKTVYDYTVKDINGNEVSLEKYKDQVLIIVNVASQCGYTDTHYTELNELYEKYQEKGLCILAFPCNQFGGQEPGTLKEILQFTQKRKVKFDVFEKIDVNGENTHPLWQFLKEAQSGTLGDFIKWNFSKFIIDRNGVPVERFGPNVSPLELESYLAKYW